MPCFLKRFVGQLLVRSGDPDSSLQRLSTESKQRRNRKKMLRRARGATEGKKEKLENKAHREEGRASLPRALSS